MFRSWKHFETFKIISNLRVVIISFAAFACSPSEPKTVTVGTQQSANVNNSTTPISQTSTNPTISLVAPVSPNNPQVKANSSKSFVASRGDTLQLSIMSTGIDMTDLSFGYKSSLSGVSIAGNSVRIVSMKEGDFSLMLVGRSQSRCMKSGKNSAYCQLNGRALIEELQAFDLSDTILITGVDPTKLRSDASLNCQGGPQDFMSKAMCGKGLLGKLAGMFIPAMSGGMTGANGSQTQLNGRSP